MAEGEFTLVREHLEAAIPKPSMGWSSLGEHAVYAMLADVAVQQRDEAALRRHAPLAEQTARRHEHTLYQAIAHRAWSVAHRLAGEYAEAEERLNQALTLFHELDTGWQIGRTFFELGELALAQSDTITARDHFAQALEAFEAMRAIPDVARTQAMMEQVRGVESQQGRSKPRLQKA
jgi:tetratricopeptide (TPR) repeat protein